MIFFNDFATCFLMFLTSSASIHISDAVKFNMADKVHRLSLAASECMAILLGLISGIIDVFSYYVKRSRRIYQKANEYNE